MSDVWHDFKVKTLERPVSGVGKRLRSAPVQ